MRKILIAIFVLFSVAGIHAASYNIDNGSQWNNASMDYTAEVKANGTIVFTACTEGQGLAFVLTPNPSKKDEYRLSDIEPNDDGDVNPFRDSSKAKHIRKDGLNLLCLYDDQDRLHDVLAPIEYIDGTELAELKWTSQLRGEYNSSYDEPLAFGDNGRMRFGAIDLTYRHVTFNGTITGVIEITGGTRLEGIWQVEITRDGIKLNKGEISEWGLYEPTGEVEYFTWARKDIPRFDYASGILLNDGMFRRLDPSVLRLMRNEIWFHHGYVPVSEDLREYLADKEWYTPRESNDGILSELSTIEILNIEMIKTTELQKEQYLKNRTEIANLLQNVYKYLNDIRRYYLETPVEEIVDKKWQTVDDIFATRRWRELREQVNAIDRERGEGSFFDFRDTGPLDTWMYDCFEGEIRVDNIDISLFDDGTANIDFQIKDAMTIDPVPICWRVQQEDGEWRIDDVFFLKDGYIDLRESMEEYVKNNANGQGGFDFEKYRQQMLDSAEANLMWRKSEEDIKLISYALIDIDNDGIQEVWVRGDEGQDYQGVYAITPEGEVILLESSDARSELVFFPSAVGSQGYYGEGESRGFVQIVKDSKPAGYCNERVLLDFYSNDMEVLEEDYNVNGKSVSKVEYDAFYKRLGTPYVPEVQWHDISQ